MSLFYASAHIFSKPISALLLTLEGEDINVMENYDLSTKHDYAQWIIHAETDTVCVQLNLVQ
jgi:hypothetical protein